MPSRSTYGLAALLVASVALNARLLTARAPPPAPAAARACPPAERPAAPPATACVEAAPCVRQLEACERRGWDLVMRAIADDRAPRRAEKPAAVALDTGPSAQAAALCAKAQASLRETWHNDRDKIAAGLVQSLGDAEEQERNVLGEVARMREVAGLGDREAAELERAYRERRGATVATARAALQQEPRDLGALVDAARGLFADEDALLGRLAGPAGREAWRVRQLEGRTVILAIAAAMADRDWEGSIRW